MAQEMMQVQVPAPDRNALMGAAVRALEQSKGIIIDSPEVYALVAEDLKAVKGRIKEVSALAKSLRDPFNVALDNLTRTFKEPIDTYSLAEKNIKDAMLAYSQEVERKRQLQIAKDQAEAQERARKEREKLEAQAEAAESSGKVEKAEALATAAQSVMAAPVVKQESATKVSGISTRTVIKWELKDMGALIEYISANPQYQNLLQVNQTNMNNLVKALGEQLPVDGIRVFKEQVMASRAA